MMPAVAFASQLERERDEWKAKYIQQNKDLGCEMMDPNGTIWDYAKKLQSEVEHLKSQLTQTQGCVTISRNGYVQELERELAAAHAEIKLLKTNLEISFRQTEQAVQDRADEHQILTAQRDRLAEALREIRKGITEPTHHRRGTLEIANEALAAVKGGYQ
jgi:hypothetical protein